MNNHPTYFKYWGKADPNYPGEPKWHPLVYHCLDVAAVGKTLLDKHHLLRRRLSSLLNCSEKNAVTLLIYLLSVHDIGKFAEVFQNKRSDLHEKLMGYKCENKSDLRHDNLGLVAWKALWSRLVQEKVFGFDGGHLLLWDLKECFDQLSICFTGHHGRPTTDTIGNHNLSANSYFSKHNIEDIFLFIADLWRLYDLNIEDIGKSVTDEDQILKASWWIAGLLVLCDWIGSDQSVFYYEKPSKSLSSYWNDIALPQSQKALNKCGLFPSLVSAPMALKELSEAPIEPTPLQFFCEKQEIRSEPQLWIMEDITGSGKTEAALLLANRIMHAEQGDGLYIGLPTMATANGMYTRMAGYYKSLYEKGQTPSLILAHGSRHLSKQFRSSIMEIDPNQVHYDKEEPSGGVQCIKWLSDNRKKALLADIGVGTIDQALLSILPSRHQGLRLIGLGTKLLVVDEVHAYDTYMHSLLKSLLTFHAGFGGSAVLLSATLPHKMRKDLISAFQKGCCVSPQNVHTESAYPLVTKVIGEKVEHLPVQASPRSCRTISVELIHNEQKAINTIIAAHKTGRCACWIRNTVEDARRAFEILLNEEDIDSSKLFLFHARFTLSDRLGREDTVMEAFGNKSTADKRQGRILIATQVVEMSLDLDFDVLLSDLSPIDSIIQRAGRLHRHTRDAAGNPLFEYQAIDQRNPQVLRILSPELNKPPKANWYSELFPKATFVYPHVGRLWLTACILDEKRQIKMPDDLRMMIEGVYAMPVEELPDVFREKSKKVEAEAMGTGSLGQYNALKYENGYRWDSGQWAEEINVPTRVGDETHTIFLAHFKGGKFVPINDGYSKWDLSSVKVSKKKLKKLSEKKLQQYERDLDILVKNEKRLSVYDVILPLEQCCENQWLSEGENGKGDIVKIVYERTSGLMIGDEIKGD